MAAPATANLVLTCAVGLFAAALATYAPAAPAAPLSLREALMGERAASGKAGPPVTARYETDEGSNFVFDRSAARPLLKFEDNPEIWVLQPAPGPRGDTIYRNDLGEPMVRATRIGGMTVFTERRPDSSPAAL